MQAKLFYDTTADKYEERHANARTKYMRSIEDNLIRKYSSGRILDIGCGTGQHLMDGHIGLDISFPMLTEAKKKKNYILIQAQAEELPFADNSFDTVLCIFTVLNLCDYNKAVQEMNRVLKKNGIAIVSVASVWDHSKDGFLKRILAKKESHLLKMRIEKFRFRFFTFNKNDLVNLFRKNNFGLVDFKGIYMIARPFWGWHRGFSAAEKIRLKVIFGLERLLQPLNKSARMYFAVFRKS